ncbi:MAG: hypothetical protein CMB77_03875 [Euryarchaeota archaeon]|nr:hypothetical protein [Euryarchaeota archaeon]|tara:strand:- start:52995 stop:53270 length:276 start_codon:yes stop_codon:yes gene_type:complete
MSFNAIRTKVLVLAGKCPAILKSSSYEDVEEWINTINRFKKPNEDYQASVYRYWARQQLYDNKEQLEDTLETISRVCNTNDTIFSLAAKSD